MGKSERQVDIAITARDEATSTFEKVAHSAREFNLESRKSGESSIERLIKGGGALGLATFAMEGLAKASEGAREAIRGVADGSMTVGEGIGHTVEKGVAAIPVLGKMVEAFRSMEDAAGDAAAAWGKNHGMSDKWIEAHRSSVSIREESEANNRAIEAGGELMVKARERATMAGLKGLERERAAADKTYKEELAQIEKVRQEKEKGMGEGARRQFEKTLGVVVEQDQQEHKAKLAEIDKKGAEEKERIADEHAKRIHDIEGQSREADLIAQGRDLDAKVEQLKRHNDQEIADIDRRVKAEKEKRPDLSGDLDKQAAQEKAALARALAAEEVRATEEKHKRNEQSAKETEKANAELQKWIEDSERQHQEKLHEYQVQGEEQRLRASGQAAEAEILQLKDKRDREFDEIKKRERDSAIDPEQANAERTAAERAFRSEEAAIRDKAHNEQIDKQNDLNHQLADVKLDSLKEEAKQGNAVAAEQARKLEIEEKYAQKKEEILKLLRDEKSLTEDQRTAAGKAIQDLAKERDDALAEKKTATDKASKASLEESDRLQGVNSADKVDEQIKAAREHLDESKKHTDLFNNFQTSFDLMNGFLGTLANPTTGDGIFGTG